MKIHILTLFPDMFPGSLGYSVIGKTLKSNVTLKIYNIRDADPYPDDKPYGGGAGMVLKPEPIDATIIKYALEKTYKIVTCPTGLVFNQDMAYNFSTLSQDLLFLCGRYDGIDQRVLDKWSFQPISLGNFILCGGEVVVLTMLEAIIRLIPGVLGNPQSLKHETHSNEGYKAHSKYTIPSIWQERSVPEVLLSGHHARIAEFRKRERNY